MAEPDAFPIWLGFPSIACLFPVLSHDMALRNTALSVERMKVLREVFRDGGASLAFELGTDTCSSYLTTGHRNVILANRH